MLEIAPLTLRMRLVRHDSYTANGPLLKTTQNVAVLLGDNVEYFLSPTLNDLLTNVIEARHDLLVLPGKQRAQILPGFDYKTMVLQ